MLAAIALTTLLRPVFATVPPPVDGNADRPAWRNGAFVRGSTTDVYVLEDEKYLYVAFAARQAVPVSPKDTVSVHVRDATVAYTFSANPLGARAASSTRDPRYDPPWSSAGRVLRDGYEVTLRIPRDAVRGYQPSQWRVQFTRTIASTARALASASLKFADAERKPAPARSASIAPAQNYRQAWRGPLAPNIPNAQRGVEFRSVQDDVTFDAVDVPQTGGRDDQAQGLTYTVDGGNVFAAVQRVETTQPGAAATAQGFSVGYDARGVTLAAGYEEDAGLHAGDASQGAFSFYYLKFSNTKGWLEAMWSEAGSGFVSPDGPSFTPGTQGYALQGQRSFGSISLGAHVDSYRGANGSLAQADQNVSTSWQLPSQLGSLSVGRSQSETLVGESAGTTAGYTHRVGDLGSVSFGYGWSAGSPGYSFSFTPSAK